MKLTIEIDDDWLYNELTACALEWIDMDHELLNENYEAVYKEAVEALKKDKSFQKDIVTAAEDQNRDLQQLILNDLFDSDNAINIIKKTPKLQELKKIEKEYKKNLAKRQKEKRIKNLQEEAKRLGYTLTKG